MPEMSIRWLITKENVINVEEIKMKTCIITGVSSGIGREVIMIPEIKTDKTAKIS